MHVPQWVKLHTFATGIEADSARVTLEETDIPVLIPGHTIGAFGPGYHGGQPGGITVFVPDAALADARELLGFDLEDEA